MKTPNHLHLVDVIYNDAAAVTGKTVDQLHSMAITAFASMLRKAIDASGKPIWTVCQISPREGLYLEVDVPVRVRANTAPMQAMAALRKSAGGYAQAAAQAMLPEESGVRS